MTPDLLLLLVASSGREHWTRPLPKRCRVHVITAPIEWFVGPTRVRTPDLQFSRYCSLGSAGFMVVVTSTQTTLLHLLQLVMLAMRAKNATLPNIFKFMKLLPHNFYHLCLDYM